MDYDLEDQQESEQFVEDSREDKPSKEAAKFLKEQKRALKHYEQLDKKQASKHKATFHRIDNQNHYVCDNCGTTYPEEKGALMYNAKGEYAYCSNCLKELYPNYKPIKLSTTLSKTRFMSNNFESQYNKGFK